MSLLKLDDITLKGKRVFVREDYNVPIQDGIIKDDTRIRASLPTLQTLLEKGASVTILSHLGRPNEGEFNPDYSLKSVAQRLSELLQEPVEFIENGFTSDSSSRVKLCENVRFLEGETKNDDTLGKKMAAHCDVFVMDAFAASHRAHSSTVAIAKYAPYSVAGPLLIQELSAINMALKRAQPPVIAIIGGAKISTKLPVLEALLPKIDILILGGGIANMGLLAKGYQIGQSLSEPELLETTQSLLEHCDMENVLVPLPTDVVVSSSLGETSKAELRAIDDIKEDEAIYDIGPNTISRYEKILKEASTIIFNGPVGVFEYTPFENGTKAISKAIASSKAYSLAGGGDTISALSKFDIQDKISYISTGGGALLECLEGKTLPAIEILQQRMRDYAQKATH